MATANVSYYLSLINNQIESQELLSDYLYQVKAMFDVALNGDFLLFRKSTIHYYLLIIEDITTRARNANEQLLVNWGEIIKLMKQSQEPPSGQTRH